MNPSMASLRLRVILKWRSSPALLNLGSVASLMMNLGLLTLLQHISWEIIGVLFTLTLKSNDISVLHSPFDLDVEFLLFWSDFSTPTYIASMGSITTFSSTMSTGLLGIHSHSHHLNLLDGESSSLAVRAVARKSVQNLCILSYFLSIGLTACGLRGHQYLYKKYRSTFD